MHTQHRILHMTGRFRAFAGRNPDGSVLVAAYVYFLAIALMRDSPYWQYGVFLPAWAGLLFAVAPLIPGIVRRRPLWLIVGYQVALFTPYQSGIGAAALIVMLALGWWNRRHLLAGIRAKPVWTNVLAWIGVYLAFVMLQWVSGFGERHSITSIAFSFYSVLLTPLCLLTIAVAAREGTMAMALMKWLYRLVIVQALVIVSYTLVIGRPDMLLAIVNGVLKPIYTVLNVPTPYPWYNPDWNFGSMTIVNYTGVVMTMGAVVYMTMLCRSRTLRYAPVVLLLTFTAFLAENALSIGAAGMAFLAALVTEGTLRWLHPARSHVRAGIRLFFIAAGIVVFLLITYAGHGKYAETHKAEMYRQSLRTALQQPRVGILGYGLGAYGSRVSYTQLLGDSALVQAGVPVSHCIVKLPGAVPEGDFHRDFSRVFFSDAAWPGTTQGLLTSGLIGLWMENGLLGSAMLLVILLLLFRSFDREKKLPGKAAIPDLFVAQFGITFLLCLSVVYNYTEIPVIVAVLLFPASLLLARSQGS